MIPESKENKQVKKGERIRRGPGLKDRMAFIVKM
jgi:hypothetical protein